jgi:YidC/Oxa1 family membrane protein insertase
MQRRFILTIILTFIVLFIWQLFMPPPSTPRKVVTDTLREKKTEVSIDTTKKVTTEERPLDKGGRVVIKSPLYTAEISKIGGALIRYSLTQFKAKDGNGPLQLIPKDKGCFLIESEGFDDRTTPYIPSRETLFLKDGDVDTLILTAETPSGVVKKTYIFKGGTYLFELQIEAPHQFALHISEGLLPTERNRKRDLAKFGALFYTYNLKTVPLGKLKKNKTIFSGEEVTWIGVRTKYFFLAAVPNENFLRRVEATGEDSNILLIGESKEPTGSLLLYFGPIDYFILKDLGYGLKSVYSFGFFLVAPFARAILYLFHFLQGFIGNYGVIILILALLMKIVFWPLTVKSLRSMRKMQELKPKLDALKKMYKDDPKKMQQEMMELYRKYKVNPFSGCLPLLLQLPIFWALYQILQNTIELRGAPFILWIRDLSTKDPYYILPLLMGGMSLLQGLMQPAQDQQSRMFALFMPIFLTVIFLNFPSGIVLYWLMYSGLSVVEQLWLKRTQARG